MKPRWPKDAGFFNLESPTNPTTKIVDIARLASAARHAGALVVVDNTFATPINQTPLALGADLVLHSATKFLGGHADALGGVACGSRELIDTVYHYREINGAALDPTSAYLLLRGMKTLHLRIRQQNQSALEIARFLEGHGAVERVFYPGLASHPGHDVARRQMRGFGGMLGFMLKENSLEAVKKNDPPAALRPCRAPTWGPWRPSWAPRPPPATWNALPNSAPPWEFRRG